MANSDRVNFTLSKKLLKKLKNIPAGQRSQFIEEAANEYYEKLKRLKFIEKLKKMKKSIWSDEDHPDLMTLEDIANYRPLTWRTGAS